MRLAHSLAVKGLPEAGAVNPTRILASLRDPSAETIFDQLYRATGRPAVRAGLAWLLALIAVLALALPSGAPA